MRGWMLQRANWCSSCRARRLGTRVRKRPPLLGGGVLLPFLKISKQPGSKKKSYPVSSGLEGIPMTSQTAFWRQRPLWVPGRLCRLAAAVGAWQGFSRPSLVCHNQIKNRIFFTSNITTAFGNRSRHALLSHQPRDVTSLGPRRDQHLPQRPRFTCILNATGARRVAIMTSRSDPYSRLSCAGRNLWHGAKCHTCTCSERLIAIIVQSTQEGGRAHNGH